MVADWMRMILYCLYLLLYAAAPSLEQVCPVEWRGVPASVVFEQLQSRLGREVAVHSDVDRALLRREIRLSASHLTGEQVFRWVARLSDLDVLFVNDSIVITRGQGPNPASTQNVQSVWPAGAFRRIRIRWNDTPLSRVAEDISAAFDVDVIFDGPVHDDVGLITFENANTDLHGLALELAKQLQASVEFVDGALWVHRRAGRQARREEAPSPPATPIPTPQPAASTHNRSDAGAMGKPVSVTSAAGWQEWGEKLSQAAGCPIQIDIPPDAHYPGIEAEGSLVDILEAGRILGLFAWTAEPSGMEDGLSVRIRVRPSR